MTSAIPTAEMAPGASSRTPRAPLALSGAATSWAAVAAWGAGLIELALGAGASMRDGDDRGAGIILIALGAGTLVWGAVTLARGRIVVPRAGVAGALGGIVAAVAALVADPARTSVLAVAALAALLISAAIACATRLRRRTARADEAPPRLWVLFVAAIVVAALVTPALAATEAGRSASPHGTHGIVDPGHH
jgi:hypothetical protein